MVIFEIWVVLISLFVLGVFWLLSCCFYLGIFSYSANLGANLGEVVGGKRGKMSNCQRGNRKICEKRNAFIYCSQEKERISAFFNMQINGKENMHVIQVHHNSSFNFFFSPWKTVLEKFNEKWTSCIVFISCSFHSFNSVVFIYVFFDDYSNWLMLLNVKCGISSCSSRTFF